MYSVVLMMALTGAGDVPEFGHRSCSGSYGCSGYCSGYSGYSGYYGCSGCSGYSGCFGGHGWRGRGCHGCSGYSNYGCCGGYVNIGCCGGYVTTGCCGGVIMEPAQPIPAQPSTPPPPIRTQPIPPPKAQVSAPANIQVQLPAEAVLYFDGHQMKTPSASRTFTTPVLQPGKAYFYTMQAVVTRDGQTATATQRVLVRAGERVQVDINFTPQGTLTARQD